ncbi:hypothetical protein FLP10_13000 [Agromyces intestinalis]|uniref:Uncharacterized protein n=1 Tax=Agromyces intestinalis TaxID=2592652 RepID=A0A5C1YI06_9MICO|nr:DUF6350 family protein [Agromyces intestinalis]QEO15238.1 hypothetical protein FLP10_13000 [Agromyces intestinalis]
MSRLTISLLAALEAAVAALVGLGVAIVPLMLLWSVHFGLTVDAAAFARAAGDVWLLGHGVDLVVTLDPLTAERTGVIGAGDPFPITIALLGFAFATVLFGRRIGRRSAAAGHALTGAVSAIVVFAGIGVAVSVLAQHPSATTSLWQAGILPAFAMALGVAIGAIGEGLRQVDEGADAATADGRGHPLLAVVDRVPAAVVGTVRAAVRVGAGAAFAMLGIAALLVAVLIAVDYATIIGLSQTLGPGVDGGLALFVGELALLPNLIVWAAAWVLGPGFAIGAATSVSPNGTLLGPLPGVPLLGIVPADGVPFGILWLLVPLVAGFAGATMVWPSFAANRATAEIARSWWAPVVLAAGAGVVAGVVLGVLAWWSGGGAGPGRLAVVGPEPLFVALMATLTVLIGALAGAFTARAMQHDPYEPRDPFTIQEESADSGPNGGESRRVAQDLLN